MQMYIGLHQPSDARHFERCCIHIDRLQGRKKPLGCQELLLDSRAFNELRLYGAYRYGPEEYANRVQATMQLCPTIIPVTQDYMCEPFILSKTGLTIDDHQRLTIERYDHIKAALGDVLLLPVLQGYHPSDYVNHIHRYAHRLSYGSWVGVGSVCKRNGNIYAIESVLFAIKEERPDLLLHGFGLKTTALTSSLVRSLLYSADSMAWSYNARRNGRNANSWQEAKTFLGRIESQEIKTRAYQYSFL